MSIRRSLLVNLVVMIVLMGAAITSIAAFASRRTARTLSEALITGSLDQTETRLREFFGPVIKSLHVARSWGEAGLLDTDSPDELNALLVPLMGEFPQISSIMVADGRGREHMVLRVGDQWSVRRIRPEEWGRRAQRLEWTEGRPEPVASQREVDYDARARPWFKGAVGRKRGHAPAAEVATDQLVHWTEPYTFFTTRDPGITASVTFEVPPGAEPTDHVIGFDILLNDITAFTSGLRPSPNGFAFVFTEAGQSIGLPRAELFASADDRDNALLKEPGEIGVAVVRDGTRAYSEQPEDRRGAYRFSSLGDPWWAGARSFPLGPDRVLVIAVGVPEADLLGHLGRMRVGIVAVTLAVLAGAIWRAARLARRYSEPIETLVTESERISRGDLDPGRPVASRVLEVHRLAEAHDRMRLGLKALMKLERDLQLARQIQERTFPNRLPRLPGFRLDAWSEPADETGGDTYDVVGYQSAAAGTPIVLSVERADRAVLLMADATGHGIGPALSVTQVRAMLRMAVRSGEPLPSIVRHLNEQLCADLPEGRFITAWLGLLCATDRTLTSFSAGQAPILRYDAKRDAFDVMEADTLPLGVVEDLEIEVGAPMPMGPGDIVAVISDGIFEAIGPSSKQFGTDRVVEVIGAARAGTPSEIIEAVRRAVAEFTGGAPAADDRTGIIIKGT
ncbi:MAG: PP2C family protein-serine/threonine phosphatase [Planctomycetota bacterium]